MKQILSIFLAVTGASVATFAQEIPSATSPAAAARLAPDKIQRADFNQRQFLLDYSAKWNSHAPLVTPSGAVEVLPRVLRMIPPVYPPEKHAANEEATVNIEFIISSTGHVLFATPIDITADNFSFAASAMVAVWQWTFSPALLNGKAVAVKMNVPIVFKLEKEPK